MKVTNLKTCHMRNAFGIDETPYFSWWLESNQENVMQEAYRICVADENGNTVWDSGKVESRQNTFVAYEDGETVKFSRKGEDFESERIAKTTYCALSED